ncbi:MAG: hypothetical protein SFW36_08645 [Leptolyngbyaceae cyanobacterium bins.59]|nr:hypothetical protein [Leptolyngbyaceae cyanobacterium bins.59]
MSNLLAKHHSSVATKMPRVAVYLPDDLYRHLEALSAQENRSLSKMVAVLVEEAFESRNKTARNPGDSWRLTNPEFSNALLNVAERMIDVASEVSGKPITDDIKQVLSSHLARRMEMGAFEAMNTEEGLNDLIIAALVSRLARGKTGTQKEDGIDKESP